MKPRIVALDYLRVLAAILVIAVHADSITISPSNYLGGISWWFASSLNTLGRTAVPLFVMISGALIYRTSRSSNSLSLSVRSWRRIILPGAIWITTYFLWQHKWHGDPLELSYLISQLFHSSFGYLHYLFIVLGLYLATPLLRKIPPAHRSAVAWGSMIFMVVFEYIRYRGTGWSWTGDTPWLWLSYIPYYLLGSTLLDLKSSRLLILLLTVAMTLSLGLAIASTYYANLGTILGHPVWWMGQGSSYFWGHFSLTDCIVSLSLYILATQLLARGLTPILDRLTAKLASATYGIYLAHVMVMDALEHYGNFAVHTITHDLWLYYLEKIFLIFILSYLLVVLIRAFKLNGILLGETKS